MLQVNIINETGREYFSCSLSNLVNLIFSDTFEISKLAMPPLSSCIIHSDL